MANELLVIDGLSDNELMELTGQVSSGSGRQYPFQNLAINKNDEDDNENIIPKGTYAVYSPEHKETLYGKVASLRPFIQGFQYRVWDENKNAYSNRSIIFKNWNDEKFDEQGGLSCGKVDKKKFAQLTEAEQAVQKKIRCSRIVFGTLTMEGVFKHKEGEKAREATVTNLPVLFRTSGSSFMPVGDAIEKFTNKNLLMFNHLLTLNLKKEKTGANIFYFADVAADIQKPPLPLSVEDIVLLRQFNDYVNTENSLILEKWQKNSSKSKDTRSAKDIDLVAELAPPADREEPPFNDSISHLAAG